MPELERQVAALGDEPDRARRELVRGQAEVGRGVEDAEAVGAEQHRPGRAHALDERALAGLRLGAELAEAGRDADERPRADRQGVVDRLLERGRRHRDDDQLRCVREVAQRRVGGPVEDGAAVSVHQVDGAPVLARSAPRPSQLPHLAGSSDAPTIATERGAKRGSRSRAMVRDAGTTIGASGRIPSVQRARIALAAARPVRTAPSMYPATQWSEPGT